jgi:quercetin dioxygenase-like cupin family protein
MSGFVRAAREGDGYDWRGAHVVIKASAQDTLEQLAVMESTYPAGLVVPDHLHDGEDELFYLLEGRLSGHCDGERWEASPGSFVFVPRDRLHAFTVIGPAPARALVIVGPPRLDGQVVTGGRRV